MYKYQKIYNRKMPIFVSSYLNGGNDRYDDSLPQKNRHRAEVLWYILRDE
jgi:hypothetical protein